MNALVRNAAFLLASTALAVGAAVPAAAAPEQTTASVPVQPVPSQEFKADSGDRCVYGYTRGTLTWRAPRPTIYSVVDVKGVVVDRPNRSDPGVGCRDDGAYTIAGFAAYAGRTVVDYALVRVDNGTADVAVTLGEQSAATPIIDRVVVQVCRYSATPVGISYCGSPQTYQPV